MFNTLLQPFNVDTSKDFTFANVSVGSGNVTAGNISATNFYFANGSVFTSSSFGNTEVAAYLGSYYTYANANAASQQTSINTLQTQVYTNTNVAAYLTGNITVGNVSATGYYFANGAPFISGSGGGGTYGNTDVATYLPTYTGNISAGNITVTGNIVGGGVRTTTSATAPSSPTVGDIWYNTSSETILRYTNDGTSKFWLDITGPSISANGPSFTDSINAYMSLPTVTISANVEQGKAYYETFGNITNSGGNLTCNFNLGAVFYVTSLTANVTASFSNVNALTNKVTATTVIIEQGATAYKISNIQINGVNQTVRWIGAASHYGTPNNTDIVSFSFIHLGSSNFRVLGQFSSYG